MASIKIEDLTESIELDRSAMSAIYGGSRSPLLRDMSRRRNHGKNESLLVLADKRRGRPRGKS